MAEQLTDYQISELNEAVSLFYEDDYAAGLPGNAVLQDYSGAQGQEESSSTITDPTFHNKREKRRIAGSTWTEVTSESPPEDGYSWRKYGEKWILGSRYPRSYYRCQYRNQGCQATKQVEQTSENTTLYRIMYRGFHTCKPPSQISDPSILLSFSGGSSTIINPGEKQEQSNLSTITTSNNNIYDAMIQLSSPMSITLDDPGPPLDESEGEWEPYDEKKDCFSIFFLIPTDYEFEEDNLVQLWMARECVKDESVGHARFNFLLNGEYLLHSGTNFVTGTARYRIDKPRIEDYLHLQRDINGSFYLKWENESKTNITNSTEIEHVSLVCNNIDASTFQTLQQFNELETLLFLRNYGQKVTHVPDDLFLSLQKLQALDLSGTHIKKLSSFVGNLIHLRYLDLSWTLIEWLPDTICSLGELQTLKLKGCSKLRGLPRQLKKLTKLRHLEVDILRQLATIPGGIGALVNLQTLSAFLVSTEDGCKIQELKELNSLTGDFCIAMLENVGNADEAKEAALNKKHHLNKLELRWTASQLLRTNNNCYDVLKCLRPYSTLKELHIFCYEGSIFPNWISRPKFNQLSSITFFKCEHVSELPLVEQLPFLKHLELVKMNGVKKIERQGRSDKAAFNRLEKLEVDEMQSLRSWNWVKKNEDDFKNLVDLTINDCPGLREFHVLSCLSSIKHLEVRGCPKLESLSETKLPDSLEDLIVEDCPMIKRNCSPQGGEDWEKIQHVTNIRICEDDEDDDEC